MAQHTHFARLHSPQDCRACLTIIGFVYSPLVLLLGAAAVIGLGQGPV